MLSKVNIAQLRDVLQNAAHALDTKSGVGSWLQLISKPEKLYLHATNMGNLRMLLKIAAEESKEGEARINAKLLQNTLNSLPDEESIKIFLSASGAKLHASYGSIQSQIAVYPDGPKAEEVFKSFPFDAKPCATISSTSLVELINRVLFCTATNEGAISEGPWLSSVLLQISDGSGVAIATNKIIAGRAEIHDKLATGSYTGGIHRGALIALKTILSRTKEEEKVTLTNAAASDGSTNETLFRFSDVILGVRQLSKPYSTAVPKIFQEPDGFQTTRVDRKVLLQVFSRLGYYAQENVFTIGFSEGKANLFTRGHNSTFQEQVALTDKVKGNITLAFATGDLVNILMAMTNDEVTFKFGSSDRNHLHVQDGEQGWYVMSPGQASWLKKGKQ